VFTRTVLMRSCRQSRALVLTYDDGPGALTSRVQNALEGMGARATFFLLGRRAAARPNVVNGLHGAGHELACHTHDHLHAWRVMPWRAAADVERGYRTLSRWVADDGLFRPPYGKLTPWTLARIRRRGARVVMWTHDSGDTTRRELPAAQHLIDAVVRDGGGVVLMHDFDRDGAAGYAAERANYVLRVTEGLLETAKREGIRVLTAGELLANPACAAWRGP